MVTSNTGDIYGSGGGSSRGAGLFATASSVAIGNNTGNIYGVSAAGNAFGARASTSATVTSNAGEIKGSSATGISASPARCPTTDRRRA